MNFKPTLLTISINHVLQNMDLYKLIPAAKKRAPAKPRIKQQSVKPKGYKVTVLDAEDL